MSSAPRPLRVLYTDVSDLDPAPGVHLLEARGAVVRVLDADASEEEYHSAAADADAIVCGYRRVTAEVMSRAPRLGVVATLSVGTDMVDVDAATGLGIRVCNVPSVATEEVATHALALLLALERRLLPADAAVRAGAWDAQAYGAPRRLSALTLGVVGFGRIGRRFATVSAPLFGRVVAYDPAQPAELPGEIAATELDALLEQSDVVSLHLPLTSSTARIIDAPRLQRMRDGVGIINVSRGGLIDQPALVDAVRSGKVRYAGLDVTAPEPPSPDDPLLTLPHTLITPHVAFASEETLVQYALTPAREVLRWLDGEAAESPVNTPSGARVPVGIPSPVR